MRPHNLLLMLAICLLTAAAAIGQASVVVIDPTKPAVETKLTSAEQAVFDRALPAVRRQITAETCEAAAEVAGIVHGAFSKAGARQALVFYQYCQTGNGLGWVGLVLIEGDQVVGNFLADSGWSYAIGSVPDINQNGLDEFTLSYGGGMHQGQGGVGVDVMEFAGGRPKGLGWFKAEEFDDTEVVTVWKVTAVPGKAPVYYKQKYSGKGGRYRKVGPIQVFKLTKANASFSQVK